MAEAEGFVELLNSKIGERIGWHKITYNYQHGADS